MVWIISFPASFNFSHDIPIYIIRDIDTCLFIKRCGDGKDAGNVSFSCVEKDRLFFEIKTNV